MSISLLNICLLAAVCLAAGAFIAFVLRGDYWRRQSASLERDYTMLRGRLRESMEEELRSRPVEVAVEVDEEAVKKAAAEAKAKAEQKAKAKIDKLQKELAEVTQKMDERAGNTRAELEQLQRESALLKKQLDEERERARKNAEMQDADVAAFGVHFANVQRDFNDLLVALNKVRAAAPETGEKLTSAVRALVEKIGGTL